MKSILRFLKEIRLSKPQQYKNMAVFPLLEAVELEPYYLTLEQALGMDCIQIMEVDEAGSVNKLALRVTNRIPVLLVEGEELQGAKQNRLINATFLIAGGTRIDIPVSCVEQGRWRYASRRFTSGKKLMPASLRRESQACMSASLARGRGHRSDQGRVWDSITTTSRRMKVASPTMAISDVFKDCEDKVSRYVDNFGLVDKQVGAVFTINGRTAGLECFGSADTFGRFFKKLVQSYALDALGGHREVDQDWQIQSVRAKALIQAIMKSEGRRHRAVSLGETISFESRTLSGTALVDISRVLHLSAFYKYGHKEKSRFRKTKLRF